MEDREVRMKKRGIPWSETSAGREHAGRAIFEQVLGANLMPTKVDVKREEN